MLLLFFVLSFMESWLLDLLAFHINTSNRRGPWALQMITSNWREPTTRWISMKVEVEYLKTLILFFSASISDFSDWKLKHLLGLIVVLIWFELSAPDGAKTGAVDAPAQAPAAQQFLSGKNPVQCKNLTSDQNNKQETQKSRKKFIA